MNNRVLLSRYGVCTSSARTLRVRHERVKRRIESGIIELLDSRGLLCRIVGGCVQLSKTGVDEIIVVFHELGKFSNTWRK